MAWSDFEEKLPPKHVIQGKTEQKRWRPSRWWNLLDGFMENRRYPYIQSGKTTSLLPEDSIGKTRDRLRNGCNFRSKYCL